MCRCGKDQMRRNAAHHHAVMKAMIGLKSYLTQSLMPNISLHCRWVTPNKNDTSDDARMTYYKSTNNRVCTEWYLDCIFP